MKKIIIVWIFANSKINKKRQSKAPRECLGV